MAVRLWSNLMDSVDRQRISRDLMSLVCVLGLLLIFVVTATILDACFFKPNKLTANHTVSPWDLSDAPPPAMHRSMVRMIGSPANNSAQANGREKYQQVMRHDGGRLKDSYKIARANH